MEFSEHIRPKSGGIETLADHPVFNAIWFNAVWFTAVLGQLDYFFLTLFFFVAHFSMIESPGLELKRWVFIAIPGILIDTSLSYAGIYQFENGQLMPVWFPLLWMAFASTPARAFVFLRNRYLVAAMIGAIAGPSSYLAGYKLGGIDFTLSLVTTMLMLSVLWAVLLPLFFLVNKHIEEGSQPYEK